VDDGLYDVLYYEVDSVKPKTWKYEDFCEKAAVK